MSVLTDLFTERVLRGTPGSAAEAMLLLVRHLRKNIRKAGQALILESFFEKRGIKEVITDPSLAADGALVPHGSAFNDGFRMVIRPDLPSTRIRFTIAHEICHTFFYEQVPEIKFQPHFTDAMEERICNLGAEELLMPQKEVRWRARGRRVSLDALEELAELFQVSLQAMFVRLISLRVWRAELWMWRKMMNGTFAAKRAWGARTNVSYKWYDEEIPKKALAAPQNSIAAGHSFWIFEAPTGRKFRPVSYETKRWGNEVVVLVVLKRVGPRQGSPIINPGMCYPLFPTNRLERKKRGRLK